MVLPRDLDRVAQGQMGSTQKVAPAMEILWEFNLLKHFLGRERFWRGNFFLQNRSPPDFADGLEMQNRLPVVGIWKVSERIRNSDHFHGIPPFLLALLENDAE